MIELSEKQLAKWKALFDKDGVKYESDEEVIEMVNNLVGYFDILIQMDREQRSVKKQADKKVAP